MSTSTTTPAETTGQAPDVLTCTASGEGPAYWFFDSVAVLRTPREGTTPTIIEMTVGAGGGAPLHVHPDLDDSFYLLGGQLAMRCGDHAFVVRPGDYVVLPRGVPHTFHVLGDEPARMLQVHQDDSFMRFIRAVGLPATEPALPAETALSVSFDDMTRIAEETGQPVIGPPMTAAEAAQIAEAAAAG